MWNRLSSALSFGDLLAELLPTGAEHVDHWQQGEFHHDHVFRVEGRVASSVGRFLVVATNCNGGVKELLSFDVLPERWALWRWRCPDNPEFAGELPPVRRRATTVHFFEPCELLRPDARSELKPEHRERQRGGGWRQKSRPDRNPSAFPTDPL